jgi:hypothetical protein
MTTPFIAIDSTDLDGITGGIEVPQWAKDAAGKVGELFSGGGVNTVVNNQAPVNQGSGNQKVVYKGCGK